MSEYINREELERLMCEQVDGVRLDDVPSIDIDDYIPIEYIKNFCQDCADEGIDGEQYMDEAGEAIVKSWLAVKDTSLGERYKGKSERSTGEWIEHKYAEEYDGLIQSNFECSKCHDWLREKTDYCPNCGARMDGEEQEHE